ncbi:matrix metalloproteinase-19 isoform X4 [Lepidochelys kempii]|uniref:matrix metalloproteinase-19 isoform X4 n=1 Tax=Lepidochelys kempii TaxID=8472 RepID=UPI003C705F8F
MTGLELLCQVCALALFASAAASDPSEEQEAVRYLQQFGYLQKPLERLTEEFTNTELTEAMRSFQLASELPATGLLDDATLAQMRQPRCGVEDPFNQKILKYLLLGRWRRKNLTYRIYSSTPDMAASATRRAIQAAFRYWSDVAPLTFREVRHGTADIRLSFHGAYSWTCSRPFDGPGKKTPAVTLPGTLPSLSPTSPSLPPAKVPDPCTDGLDALMFGPYEQTYAFKGGYVWTVTDFGTGPLKEIPALWKGLPERLDAAVHSPRTGRSYFFKGDKVWRYRGFQLDPGYPKALTRVPAKIDAAFYWPGNKKIFLFKGTGYWQWDELAWSDFSGYPKKIAKLFTGVPSHLDAAVAWENGRVYFFQGGQYWRVNTQLRVEKGYPLSTAERWMHCEA